MVVVISGRLGSDTPTKCEYSSLQGVIVEEMAEQHFLKHNDAGLWIQDLALMLSMCKEIPWYLLEPTGLVLTVGSEVFEESGQSPVRGTLNYLQGFKMLGVKRIEPVLPTETPLPVVGEILPPDLQNKLLHDFKQSQLLEVALDLGKLLQVHYFGHSRR